MHTERVRERERGKQEGGGGIPNLRKLVKLKEKKKEERGKEQKDWSVVEIGKEGGKKKADTTQDPKSIKKTEKKQTIRIYANE